MGEGKAVQAVNTCLMATGNALHRRSSTRGTRRVGPRTGPSRIRWDRIGRVALVIVLFAVMVSYLNPAMNLFNAWQDSRSSVERLQVLEKENLDLRRELTDAGNPAVVEREARRLGMARMTERAYVVRSR